MLHLPTYQVYFAGSFLTFCYVCLLLLDIYDVPVLNLKYCPNAILNGSFF